MFNVCRLERRKEEKEKCNRGRVQGSKLPWQFRPVPFPMRLTSLVTGTRVACYEFEFHRDYGPRARDDGRRDVGVGRFRNFARRKRRHTSARDFRKLSVFDRA